MEGKDLETVAAEGQDAIRTDGFLKSYGITVAVEAGTVIVLTGRVPSYHHKQMAQEAIKKVGGGKVSLSNRIEVVRT